MPQDILRSAVYRSFVTCDDSKGVVECGTIRRYKSGSKKMEGDTVQSQRIPKNLKSSASCKEKGKDGTTYSADELNNPSFRLMEVSKGAQKLNRVIDSWSKRMSFGQQSGDIANELLKGAIDLQDSLVMLGKLQDASQSMAKPKKTKETDRGLKEDLGIERLRSRSVPFEDHDYQMGFQRPRFSADGSSRDCYEELRKVIKDSLARQNLLPKSSCEERVYANIGTLESSPDNPSTSSSQSSVVCASDFTSSDSFLLSKVPLEKPKDIGLIAKLMGLENFPSNPLKSAPEKQPKGGNTFRPTFDIDFPTGRRPKFSVQKVNQKQRTLEEIIETMQFKGFLKNKKSQIYPSNNTHLEKRFTVNAPPIVLIKPLPLQCLQDEEICNCKLIQEGRDLGYTEAMFTKQTRREWVPPKTTNSPQEALNSNVMRRQGHAQGTRITRLYQEKRTKKNRKEILAKLDGKEVKNDLKPSSNKMKACVPENRTQKMEAVDKKVDKIQKATPCRKKQVEVETVRPKSVSGSHDHAKVPSTKLRKPENEFNILKSVTLQQKDTPSNSMSKCQTQAVSLKFCDRSRSTRNRKPANKKVPQYVEKSGPADDSMQRDITYTNVSEMSTTKGVKFPMKEGTDAFDVLRDENCNNIQSFLSEDRLLTTQQNHGSSIGPSEEPACCMQDKGTDRICSDPQTDARGFLLRSPSFIGRAEELLNTVPCQSLVLQSKDWHDHSTADAKLLLDCANELLEHKSLGYSPTTHPLLQRPAKRSRICISFEQLVDEVCHGIVDLKSHSKPPNYNIQVDTLQTVLARDLQRPGLACGSWDVGWKEGFTLDEIEQLVCELERLVISKLTEDLLTDFVFAGLSRKY